MLKNIYMRFILASILHYASYIHIQCNINTYLRYSHKAQEGEFKQQVQIYSILFKKHSLGVENSSFFLGLLLISCIYRVIC